MSSGVGIARGICCELVLSEQVALVSGAASGRADAIAASILGNPR
jgi:hypothetical protein